MFIREIAEIYRDVLRELSSVDGIQAAATFGGLMLSPELQANHLRLDALAHLSMWRGNGRSTPERSLVQRTFKRIGDGWIGRMEDPSEDVFTSIVHTEAGNFKVREGTYEGAAFHLQRVLNIMAAMPREGAFVRIHRAVEALLRISDAVLNRAGLGDYVLGEESPKSELPPRVAARLSAMRKQVLFTPSDLHRLGIARDDLSDFAFELTGCSVLGEEQLFHTSLQRRPIVFRGDNTWFLLPSSTGAAITRYVAECAAAIGRFDAFESAVVAEYTRLFRQSPLLTQAPNAPIRFQRIGNAAVAGLTTEVDLGRILQLVFVTEHLDDFLTTGFSGTFRLSEPATEAIQFHVNKAAQEAFACGRFKEGVSVIVVCGIGRRISMPPPQTPKGNWTIEIVPRFDFDTLCWVPEFDALSLIRLAAAVRSIETKGVAIFNASGLLNLVAWTRQLKGHLVPHASIPEAFAIDDGGPRVIAIEQNAVRSLRHEVLTTFDGRRVPDVSGTWTRVRREARSLFKDERDSPLYFDEDAEIEGRLRAVYVAKNRPYWVECIHPEHGEKRSVVQHFKMVYGWLRRAAPVIDKKLTGLSDEPVEFRVSFAEITPVQKQNTLTKSKIDVGALIRTANTSSTIDIEIHQGFDEALRQPENAAERALIEAMVAGIADAAVVDIPQTERDAIVSVVCPNTHVRFLHSFEARTYRDFIPREELGMPVLADDIDSATFVFGLGWKVRSQELGGDIAGIKECTAFLNSVVMIVLDELCASLKTFNRRQLLELLLCNHEAVECERGVWRRTARANIATHDDHESALRTIVTRESELTATSMACRILMEAAICECSEQTGESPGYVDLTRLMAQALIAYHWGGYSDVIHWGAAEARLRITPLGDVHFDPLFMDMVYEPFGRTGSERQVKWAVESYSDLFAPAAVAESVEAGMDSQFLSAWEDEFNASIDQLLRFHQLVEHHCREQGNPALAVLPRTEMVRLMMSAIERDAEEASDILNQFVLKPRLSWRTPETGFSHKDWFPWRFRRRYATVRAPFLQLGSGENSDLVFAPGLARHAFALTVGAYERGEIDQSQVRGTPMRSWLGTRNHRHRLAFNTEVLERMAALGWKVRKERTVPALIGGGLDRNYGDVDVVAWNMDNGRVLLMECKDVQFHRAMGEVAEQLHDFRGESLADGKPDLLKKHLDRVDKIRACSSAVARALRIRVPVTIEGHIVFRNPVPMRFVADRLASKIRVSLFDELDQL